MDTMEALIAGHGTERHLYRRMIDIGIDAQVCMMIMAFWLWLESQGFQDIVRKICTRDNKFLALVCVEAEAALASLQATAITHASSIRLPNTTSILVNIPFSLHDIFMNKERVSKGISQLFNGVCTVLFKDTLEGRVGLFGEGTSQQGAMLGVGGSLRSTLEDNKTSSGEVAAPTEPRVQSKLDPSAKEWNPVCERVPEEDRCLYLTFSKGYPLTPSQIFAFFTRKYGACVERVYVHRPEHWNRPPLFGKVVFKSSFVPALILNGQKQMKFVVNGRALWCKKFAPNRNRINGEI